MPKRGPVQRIVEPLGDAYDSMEFTLANALSDYNVRSNVTGAFENMGHYTTINIRSDQNITAKLNASTNRAVTVERNKPFELDNLLFITNIFLSNTSGSTANVKIIGVRKTREV